MVGQWWREKEGLPLLSSITLTQPNARKWYPPLTVREREKERERSEIAHFESDVIMIQLKVPNINEFLMSEVLGF